MRRFHISIAVDNFSASLAEYSKRLGCEPEITQDGRYALWRTDLLNFTISCRKDQLPTRVRHIGFEDDSLHGFSEQTDCNGIVWEYFSPAAQQAEIDEKFPQAIMHG
ncbi:MAG: hypothetical protein AB7L92_06005 [Alphaproteobacteria bacterium]